MVGDGEAETGPLEGSWKGVSFLNPARDGAVLPILHLNGYKICRPDRARARPASDDDRVACSRPRLRRRTFVARRRPAARAPGASPRRSTAATSGSARIQTAARSGSRRRDAPRWPAIVLRTPKGWTGPDVVDGVQVEGTFRAHQVPLADVRDEPRAPAHARGVAAQLPARGALRRATAARRRAGARWRPTATSGWARTRTPTAAGCCAPLRPARLHASYALTVDARRRPPRSRPARSASCCATSTATTAHRTSGSSAPTRRTPTGSARSSRSTTAASMDATDPDRRPRLARRPGDGGALSEHLCQGWLEGYLLTGRHGLFATYEAFAMVVGVDGDPAREVARGCARPRRGARRSPSLNILLTSTCWRNDHNGFSHQGPGLIDTMISLSGDVVARLPAAGRELPALGRRPLPAQPRLRQPHRHRQAAAAAVPRHRRARRALRARRLGLGLGRATARDGEPDVVLACAGDVPTLETLAAALAAARARARPARPRRQRRRPDGAVTRATTTRTALTRSDVRRALHRRRRRRLRLPRLPARVPPARSTAGRTPSASTCAASTSRARPRRRSTWSCSTR